MRRLREALSRPITRALLITVLSLAFWTTWNYVRTPCHVYADLSCGQYTDHFSHVGMTRIFTAVGFEIYDRPRGELGRPLTAEEQAALPEDLRTMGGLRTVDGWPADKPFITTWPGAASFYPPGDLVMYAPVAAAYSFFDVSFTRLNLATIQLLLVYAHVTVFLLLLVSAGRAATDRVDVLTLLIAYFLVVRWSLDGFYDGGWIAPLVLAPAFLATRRGFPAVTAVTAGAFAHFRGVFYLPWAVQGVAEVVRGRQWRPWTAGKTAMTAATLVMGGLTAVTFLRLRDLLEVHQMTNPFNPSYDAFHLASLVTLALVMLPGLAVFVWRRSWLDVAMLVWIFFVITQLPELRPWDSVALVPWMVAPAVTSANDPLVRQFRAATAVLVMAVVFGSPIEVGWLKDSVDDILLS
ncbi:MAG TPA: hypothetical protein VHI71_03335 [Actinomycetota bacterium]|nr:hypothetical protein [Actinomycetota bacterium]